MLKDFRSYVDMQREVDRSYRDRLGWAKKSLMNLANVGKFSSDRTIQEYADEIWEISSIKLDK